MADNLIRWPRFAGSPKNAATLSPTFTRKAQIVEQQLGVKLVLVQGAPSGSKLSGGTHYGPGNAADWGTSWSTKTDLAISQAFRRLNCVSWVRGQDADSDGRKDDSFDPHIHVIDVDDRAALNPAQLDQLRAYLDGRNGLVNNQRDREGRPSKVQTLAQYLAASDVDAADQHTDTTTQEDVIMAITKAQQADFNALLIAALQDPKVRDYFATVPVSASVGLDLDRNKKADSLAQLVGHTAARIDGIEAALAKIAKKVGA